jgi:cysteine desulfuration protein SufE
MNDAMPTAQQLIINEFAALPDWDARYKHIIALGKALPPIDPQYQQDQYKVQGCQSQVWLHAQLTPEGLMQYDVDSDALIVRGLVALLARVYSGQTPAYVMATPPDFFDEIELGQHLSMQRSNGLAAMLKQMKLYAMAFHMKQQ